MKKVEAFTSEDGKVHSTMEAALERDIKMELTRLLNNSKKKTLSVIKAGLMIKSHEREHGMVFPEHLVVHILGSELETIAHWVVNNSEILNAAIAKHEYAHMVNEGLIKIGEDQPKEEKDVKK